MLVIQKAMNSTVQTITLTVHLLQEIKYTIPSSRSTPEQKADPAVGLYRAEGMSGLTADADGCYRVEDVMMRLEEVIGEYDALPATYDPEEENEESEEIEETEETEKMDEAA